MMCTRNLGMRWFYKCIEKGGLLLVLVDLCRNERAKAVERIIVLQNG